MNATKPAPLPQLIPIAHWHIPLNTDLREVSLVFYGRPGKRVTLHDLDVLLEFIQIAQKQRKPVVEDNSI
jgi:hypothetical protein